MRAVEEFSRSQAVSASMLPDFVYAAAPVFARAMPRFAKKA